MADPPPSVPSAHSAAIYRYAVELVEDTRRANETKMADARDLAAVVRIADEPAADGPKSDGEAAPPKKRTRRGSRGGRNRRKKPAAAGADAAPADPGESS